MSNEKADVGDFRPAKPKTISGPTNMDRGRVDGRRVVFDNWKGQADRPAPRPFAPRPPGDRVGVAVLGLGRLALEEILPAFAATTNARPIALISGSADKARLVGAQYGIEKSRVFTYDDWEHVAADEAIEGGLRALGSLRQSRPSAVDKFNTSRQLTS